MSDRKSILLINDFFIYYVNLNLVEIEFINSFSNIKVIFFFTNVTSLCQSLDQDIYSYLKKLLQKIMITISNL